MVNGGIIGGICGRWYDTVVSEASPPTLELKKRLIRFCQLLITFEWLFLLLILPLALFPTPVRALALLLIPALWLARKIGYGRFVPLTPVDWPLLGLLLMVLVSLYATFDMNYSLGKIAGMIYGIAVFYATVAFVQRGQARLWWGVAVLLASELGVALLGIVGTQWGYKFPLLNPVISLLPQRILNLPGAASGFSPNQLAGTLILAAPLAWTLTGLVLLKWRVLWRAVRPYQAILILVATAGTTFILSGILLLTQSRGGLFGFGVGALFILVAIARRKGRWLFGAMLLLFVIGMGILVVRMGVEGTVNLLFEQAGLEAGSDQVGTLSGRMEIWSRAFYAIQDFPFTGVGMNNFRRVVPILYPLFLIPPDMDIAHAHNHLLQAALDLGLPGLVAYLALWIIIAALLWQSYRQTHSAWLRGLALGTGGSLLAYFVFGMIDVVALGAKPGFIFWLLVGLTVALHALVRDASNDRLPAKPVSNLTRLMD